MRIKINKLVLREPVSLYLKSAIHRRAEPRAKVCHVPENGVEFYTLGELGVEVLHFNRANERARSLIPWSMVKICDCDIESHGSEELKKTPGSSARAGAKKAPII